MCLELFQSFDHSITFSKVNLNILPMQRVETNTNVRIIYSKTFALKFLQSYFELTFWIKYFNFIDFIYVFYIYLKYCFFSEQSKDNYYLLLSAFCAHGFQ